MDYLSVSENVSKILLTYNLRKFLKETTRVTDLYCPSTLTRRTTPGRKEADMIVLILDNRRNVAGRY